MNLKRIHPASVAPDDRLFLIDRLIRTVFENDDVLDVLGSDFLSCVGRIAEGKSFEASEELYTFLRDHFSSTHDIVWVFISPKSVEVPSLSETEGSILRAAVYMGADRFILSNHAEVDASKRLAELGLVVLEEDGRVRSTVLGRHIHQERNR